MKILDVIAWVLVVIGAINWGCVGFFHFNLVDFFFGNMVIERVIYDAIGVAGIYFIVRAKKMCGSCHHQQHKRGS